jgi:hypothetical protein
LIALVLFQQPTSGKWHTSIPDKFELKLNAFTFALGTAAPMETLDLEHEFNIKLRVQAAS